MLRVLKKEYGFQKDLIVWKLLTSSTQCMDSSKFQKDLIVWKQACACGCCNGHNEVSEGLNSVETNMHQLKNGYCNQRFRRT